MDVEMHAIAQNDHKTTLLKWVGKIKISHRKKSKNQFLSPKNCKIDQKSKCFRKRFFGRNRFRMVQNAFKNDKYRV